MLGDLNPLPFPAIAANCAGWIAYSYVTSDVLVLWPNAAGFLLGMFYTMSAYGLADTKTRDRQIAIMLLFSAVIIVVGSVGTLGHMSQHGLKTLWGFTSNAILLIFYASPLSTVLEVVRSRSSATLNLPLSVMNVINGTLWLVYGLAISDLFIAVPNGVGAALGIVYCALLCVFPHKAAKRSPPNSDSNTTSSRRELMVDGGATVSGDHELGLAAAAVDADGAGGPAGASRV